MKTKDKILLSVIFLAAFFWIIYLVKSILTPFVLALIIAYLLNPVISYLVRKTKFSRLIITSLIIGLFFAILTAAVLFIIPIIYSEFVSFLEALPQYLQVFAEDLYPQIVEFAAKFGIVLQSDIFAVVDQWKENSDLLKFSEDFLQNILSSTLVLINVLSLIFITPILVFYIVNDWEILTKKIDNYLPKKFSGQIKEVLSELDIIMSGYIHGQINVCLILGVIYASLLSFSGLDFGFLIGFLTGFFAFIPYVGMLFGVTAAIVISLFQWGFDGIQIATISGIFIFGQLIESNFLTPKLIGKRIGLHPIWVVFGLFFFAALFGFVGILIAVPLTAICGVLIRFGATKYKKKFT
jgi:predicted PurR-regulated permease PerM